MRKYLSLLIEKLNLNCVHNFPELKIVRFNSTGKLKKYTEV